MTTPSYCCYKHYLANKLKNYTFIKNFKSKEINAELKEKKIRKKIYTLIFFRL